MFVHIFARTFFILTACTVFTEVQAQDVITGTVAYRERILLRPDAVLEIELLDVSRADAKAEILASTLDSNPGAPPYSFSLPYEGTKIDPGHRYVIRAQITESGSLKFSTTTAYPVLTRGASDTVDIILQMTQSDTVTPHRTSPQTGAHGLMLPGSFQGELPCADCEGIFYRLSLWPDQSYFLRRIWRGPEQVVDTLGRWHVAPGTNTLVLAGGTDAETSFRIGTNNDLRLLDRSGNDIVSDLNYQLVGGELAEFDARLNLRGMYSLVEDRPVLVECLSQRTFPVAKDGAFDALPKDDSNLPIMISLDGHIENRHAPEGADAPTLVVDRFVNTWPGETCERNLVNADLVNTYWKLLRLGDTILEVSTDHREPHILFQADGSRYAATVGCNQLAGGYELKGANVKFNMGLSTMMACQPPLDQYESLLGLSLAETASWKIDGQVLELFDDAGKSIALMQAVYLP